MRDRLFASTLCAAALFAGAAGCKNKEQPTPAPPPTAPAVTEQGSAAPAPEPPRAGSAATLTDAHIAAIVVAANQVDIDMAKLALEKSKNPEVRKFAERMVTDHSAVNKAAVELVTKLKVTPEESDVSKTLVASGADTHAKLAKLAGDTFDRAYVANEVAYHEAVIVVLKSQLIPGASNQELKDALVAAQPAFDAHLEHARTINASFAGGSAAHAHHP